MSTKIDALINVISGSFCAWRGSMVKDRKVKLPTLTLKLYDIEACPFCRLVREVLSEMDVDVMIYPCPRGGTRFRLEAARIGGKAQFPLLVDDNTQTVLYESSAIIEYLTKTYGSKPRQSNGVGRVFAMAGSSIASFLMIRLRGMTGMRVVPARAAEKSLELYSFEASPFSKPVRARMCELELPYLLHNTAKAAMKDIGPPSWRDKIFKAPQGTSRNRHWLSENTGQVQVPYLIDANTGTAMYESDDILRYLNKTYAL
jgi:glutathione S-transferase